MRQQERLAVVSEVALPSIRKTSKSSTKVPVCAYSTIRNACYIPVYFSIFDCRYSTRPARSCIVPPLQPHTALHLQPLLLTTSQQPWPRVPFLASCRPALSAVLLQSRLNNSHASEERCRVFDRRAPPAASRRPPCKLQLPSLLDDTLTLARRASTW